MIWVRFCGVAVCVLVASLLAARVSAETPPAPSCNPSIADSFSPRLSWGLTVASPPIAQHELQILPYKNDGPGLDLVRAGMGGEFTPPQPPAWYGLLPDMGYIYRVRFSSSAGAIGPDDGFWGPWGSCSFRTPAIGTSAIHLVEPANGFVGAGPMQVLRWGQSDSRLFYYEVQLSKDATFNTDPGSATAAVYWNLVHGGVSAPANSWTVPADAPLEPATFYYWRVRPRIQGDGAPVAWTQAWRFGMEGAVQPTPAPTATPAPSPTPKAAPAPTPIPGPSGGSGVYYANCDEARRAGAAPIYRGEPGYRPGLDRDGDGIACE